MMIFASFRFVDHYCIEACFSVLISEQYMRIIDLTAVTPSVSNSITGPYYRHCDSTDALQTSVAATVWNHRPVTVDCSGS